MYGFTPAVSPTCFHMRTQYHHVYIHQYFHKQFNILVDYWYNSIIELGNMGVVASDQHETAGYMDRDRQGVAHGAPSITHSLTGHWVIVLYNPGGKPRVDIQPNNNTSLIHLHTYTYPCYKAGIWNFNCHHFFCRNEANSSLASCKW